MALSRALDEESIFKLSDKHHEELSKPPSETHHFCAHAFDVHVSAWGDPVPVDAIQR